jgi:hypothetical protein
MKITLKLIIIVAVVYISQFALVPYLWAELIEPTRNIGEKTEELSRLTVVSEPPGLKVALDGKGLGKTPAFLVEVKSGLHTLKVRNLETEIYLEPGKILKVSLFKDEFVQVPVEVKAPEKKPESEQQREAAAAQPAKPASEEAQAQEKRDQAKKRWMKFVDGTLPSF